MVKLLSDNSTGADDGLPASSFKQRVLKIISVIPKGKVMSYGQVAAMAGSLRAARQVGGILRHYEGSEEFPWWRVVNNAGRISIKGNFIATPAFQKQMLEGEGVVVDKDYSLDMEKYRYGVKI